MFFFSIETSKAMAVAGCRPLGTIFSTRHPPVYWEWQQDFDTNLWRIQRGTEKSKDLAFCLSDFLSPEKQARENCQKWFGPQKMNWSWKNPTCSHCGEVGTADVWHIKYCWELIRHNLLDLPEGTDIEKWFLETRAK